MTISSAGVVAEPAPSWTMLGVLDSAHRALVDDDATLLLPGSGVAVAWAVHADDGWHRPGIDAEVRQRLLGDAPVVESRVRVPGGDIVHRAYVARPAGGGEPVAVLEIENQTPVPAAVALRISHDPGAEPARHPLVVDGANVMLGEQRILVLPREPAAPPADEPDLADALAFPLPHTASLRVLASPATPSRRAKRGGARIAAASDVPDADQVARGWSAQRGSGAAIRLPDARLQAALDAARCTLLIAANDLEVVDDRGSTADQITEALVLTALARTGFVKAARTAVGGLPARLVANGWFDRSERNDTNGALLWAIDEAWRSSGRDDLAVALASQIAGAAAGIDRRRSRRRRGSAPAALLPAGPAPSWLGGAGVHFWDDLWSVRGLRSAAALLASAGEARAAHAATQSADELAAHLRLALEASARGGVPASGPDRAPDATIAPMLVGSGLLDVLDEDVAHRVAEHTRARRGDVGVLTDDGTAVDVRATLLLALHDAARGDAAAHDALVRLVAALPHTLSLPDLVHPTSRRGAGDRGHDVLATALLVLGCRALLIRDAPDGIDLVPVAPAAWWGQRWEILHAPTRHGAVSSAVRWKDDRPTLHWELAPHNVDAQVVFTAGALAPGWSTDALHGEVTFEPIAAPAGVAEQRRGRRIQVQIGGTAGRTSSGQDAVDD